MISLTLSLNDAFPLEIYEEIAKNLSWIDQVGLLFINKSLNFIVNDKIKKLSDKKIVVEELLSNPNSIKTGLVFIKRFKVDKTLIRKSLLQIYRKYKQPLLLILIGFFWEK